MRIPANIFRDESPYSLKLNFANKDLTFQENKKFNFVPKSCQYYIVSGSNSYSSYLNYTDMQSYKDITFTLSPVQLKSYCNEVSFYN